MRVEEQRLDWLFLSEEITISLEGYSGGFPLELRIFAEDGQLAFSRLFTEPVLSFGRQQLSDGRYTYQVWHAGKEVRNGALEVP